MTVSDAILEYLQPKTDGALRCILQYDEDDTEVVYLRGDVEADYTAAEIERIVDDLRAADPSEDSIGAIGNAGEFRADIRLYDGTVTIHVPQREDVGTLVTLDPRAASNLVEFTYDLLRVISRQTPQTILDAPTWGDSVESGTKR